ncbi:antitoxin VbhA family protein [Mycobacteroides abscessus]|uniref:antitoxin VbhA family protein n=1 Tax=Mycobacteroides abscessus TaxID=36809 RepID=UPI000C26547C|nr:antitoxin VbhA family protein [Mycobacteroides abscessus]
MSREIDDGEPDSLTVLAELLHGSDLSATLQRAVHDAVVSGVLEGATPDRTSMLRLIEFAAGRITFDQYKEQVIQTHISNLHHELTQADADDAAGNTITGEDLRKRYGLPVIPPS